MTYHGSVDDVFYDRHHGTMKMTRKWWAVIPWQLQRVDEGGGLRGCPPVQRRRQSRRRQLRRHKWVSRRPQVVLRWSGWWPCSMFAKAGDKISCYCYVFSAYKIGDQARARNGVIVLHKCKSFLFFLNWSYFRISILFQDFILISGFGYGFPRRFSQDFRISIFFHDFNLFSWFSQDNQNSAHFSRSEFPRQQRTRHTHFGKHPSKNTKNTLWTLSVRPLADMVYWGEQQNDN